MGPNGQIKCELYVTAENGTASITGVCVDYSKYFFSDNDAYAPKYEDGLIKLVEAYKVTFEWEDNYTIVVPVPKNDTVTVPEGEPPKDGYYFVGWLLDGKDYDLSQPVTSDITLTPKWVKSGETAVSVNHESFYVADLHEPATVYLAAYKDGVLIDLWSGTPEFDPDYPYLFSKTIAETGLDTSQADKITVFLWGENLQSKCGSETVIK